MSLQIESRQYRISFLEPILGSSPSDPEIFSKFVAAKASTPEKGGEETEAILEIDTKGMTVFPCDENGLFIYDYQVKGFLKEAANTLKDSIGIKSLRSKIEKYVFVKPRKIYLLRHGSLLKQSDGILERALRISTMYGDRNVLASSEKIDLPCEINISIELLQNKDKIDWEVIETLLDYGQYKGIGQWRNGSYGSFNWQSNGVV